MGPDLILPLLFGVIVGFSLGLTGAAEVFSPSPFLIFGLGTGVREAVGISLPRWARLRCSGQFCDCDTARLS